MASHPPTDIHPTEMGDIEFLHNLGNQVRASAAMADNHAGVTRDPRVAALAAQISSVHANHLVRIDGLRARLNNASTSSSSSSSSGHGQGQGNAYGAGDGGGGSRADNPKQPYGSVTYADPGYQADKVKRYPLDTEAHVRAAWSYINMPKNASKYSSSQLASIKSKIRAAAKRFGIEISDDSSNEMALAQVESERSGWPAVTEEREIAMAGESLRTVRFETDLAGDGHTFEGYAAVFDSPAQINDHMGSFEETIRRGAFTRTLQKKMPVLMFNHGKHPLIGDMPLGVINHAEEDSRGLFVRARLSDNWLIEPVRDAVAEGAIDGMSFRFSVPIGGDVWSNRNAKRAVHDLDCRELGPVVFPAYELTTAQVRSALDCIDCDTGRPYAGSVGGGEHNGARPGKGTASRIRTSFRILDVHPLLSREHYRA